MPDSASLGPSPFSLRWRDLTGVEQERELIEGSLSIGRASTNDLVLADGKVSRLHARIDVRGDHAVIRDLGSRNGTFVSEGRVHESDLRSGDAIGIGPFTLEFLDRGAVPIAPTLVDLEGIAGAQAPPSGPDPLRTLAPEQPGAGREVEAARRPSVVTPGAAVQGLPAGLLDRPLVSERDLANAGLEVAVTEYLALGGGMGSFVMVDLLRNSGVPTADITVIGNEEHPYGRYERLTRYSQIPRHERIRSNSESCPDNVWGFPGYAPREAWKAFREGRVRDMVFPLWATLGEPVLATTYSPKVGDVFETMEREAQRIGWNQMHRRGRIRVVRKTEEGRLVAIVSASDESGRRHFAVAGRFLHLAVGYPAIELLPDLTHYRETYEKPSTLGSNDQPPRVVAAYESHDHVYKHLQDQGGIVLLRGRGIVASRVIQRLYEERRHNKDIVIVHLHRSRIVKGHRFGLSSRKVENQFEFQPFNWPKGSWGGEHLALLQQASDAERKRLLDAWGGTTTANRPDWRRILREGMTEGWYRPEFGIVREVKPSPDGQRVSTIVESRLAGGGSIDLTADYVIDCTGLEASPERAPFIADLYQTYNLRHNPRNRLAVTNDFEIGEMRNGQSAMYAAGALTLGGPHAGVDTFLALQYCASAAARAMRRHDARALRPLSGLYSFRQWLKWTRGQAP